LKFYNPNRKVYLTISKEFIDSLFQIAKVHYPNEFGGYLLGKYDEDYKGLLVNKSIEPHVYSSSSVSFTRSSKGIEEKFIQEKEQYYVGEWHTHPNNSSAFSTKDLKAMRNIISKNQLRIKNPILLILGINEDSIIDFSIYLLHQKKLVRYEQI
jgi:integrative and conjugative element protein (TIGR02256 family)